MTWHEDASCRDGYDPTMWETKNNGQPTHANQYAIDVCKRCPVQTECLIEALEVEEGLSWPGRWHIFGGTTPRERSKLDGGPRRKQKRGLVA